MWNERSWGSFERRSLVGPGLYRILHVLIEQLHMDLECLLIDHLEIRAFKTRRVRHRCCYSLFQKRSQRGYYLSVLHVTDSDSHSDPYLAIILTFLIYQQIKCRSQNGFD